jgi:hypothetical protein
MYLYLSSVLLYYICILFGVTIMRGNQEKPVSYSDEPKLVVRLSPSQVRFIQRIQDDMGMNKSSAVRFVIDLVRFEHQTTQFVHSVMERHAWVGMCERRMNMTDKEIVAWCVDFVRYLESNGLLKTLLDEVMTGDAKAEKLRQPESDDEQSMRVRSMRVKRILDEEGQVKND